MKDWSARCVALLCTVACATVVASSAWSNAQHVRTEDRNGDGRPDVWRHYDNQGQPTEAEIDTNFDGRADVQEYYVHGMLVRRESDRNLDDQVDLVEEFDAATHERVRSIVDIDYDGTADLLVLFRDGRPVFSKPVHSVTSNLKQRSVERRGDGDKLVPLTDTFRTDTSISVARATWTSHDGVGLSTSSGLPGASIGVVSPIAPPAQLVGHDAQPRALAHLFLWSPRGPPLS